MHELRRWPSAAVLITLFALTITPANADEAKASDASAHILQAEMALQRKDYLKATIEYRKAAEISNSAETARKATTVAFAYRFDDEAVKAAKRWVKLEPGSDEATIYLAQSYFRVGDLRNARRHFQTLVEKGEEKPGQRLVSLVPYLSEDADPQNADKLMRALAKPYKNSSLAHYAAAVLALEAGDSAHAMQRALKSSELDPDNVKPKLLYARALLIEGNADEAIEYTARIIGDDPDPDPSARMELAIMYMMSGRDDDALSQVNQVLLEQSGRPDALRLMAIINFRQEYLDAAWDDFQDLLATGQYRMDALYYLREFAVACYRHDPGKSAVVRFPGTVRAIARALRPRCRVPSRRRGHGVESRGAVAAHGESGRRTRCLLGCGQTMAKERALAECIWIYACRPNRPLRGGRKADPESHQARS